jgi:type IV fimbrial biogenesis protein FimT
VLTSNFLRFQHTGFTLIESLTVVAILAVLSALAAPSFSRLLMSHQVGAGAEGILVGLNLARTEAVRRNELVSFALGSATGWAVAVVGSAEVIQSRSSGESGSNLQVAALNDQDTVIFDALGRVRNYDPTRNLTQVVIAAPSGISGVNPLRIDVLAGGQVRICNLGIVAANDPRVC